MRKLKTHELNRLTPDEYKVSAKTPIVVVLDNVRSMNNIGSAFRTADAFRVEMLVLIGITARPPHRDINKTALGATDTVDWKYFATSEEAITWLKKEGYTIIPIEQVKGSKLLQTFTPDPNKAFALVFGNEVNGVSEEIISQADDCLEIPQIGSKHSLNIAVSIGVVLWDFAHKLNIFNS